MIFSQGLPWVVWPCRLTLSWGHVPLLRTLEAPASSKKQEQDRPTQGHQHKRDNKNSRRHVNSGSSAGSY